MTDPIEAMKAAGWEIAYSATESFSPDNEVITFHKPRVKPNAVVGW